MPIFTITASDQTGTMSGFLVNSKTITVPMSSFSPQPDSVLDPEVNFLVKAVFNYHIRCGYDNGTYKGDAGLRFDKTSSTTYQIFSEGVNNKSDYDGYQVGYSGFSDSKEVTDYVYLDDGSFLQIYSTYAKSIAAPSNYGYLYGLEDLSIDYYYIPYKVSLIAEHGSISRSLVDFDSYTITLTASPATGYHFVRWHDGNTNASRTESITGDCEFIAYFEPNTYTVKLCDYSSGSSVVLHSIPCVYDQETIAPALPIKTPPEGYGTNPVGWAASYDGFIRYGTQNIYYNTSTSPTMAQYTKFLNQTSVNGATVFYYYNFYPYQYKISYKSYTENNTSEYSLSTAYRIYNNGNYSLKALPTTITSGYKLSNQMTQENGPVNTSLTNSWFTSSAAMKPTDNKITEINSTYIGDIDLYSLEVPINYSVCFKIFDMDNSLLATYLKDYLYAEDIELPFILEDKEGRCLSQWYAEEQDVSEWYIQPNSDDDIISPTVPVVGSITKNLTTIDQSVVNRYIYYIPKAYLLQYAWLDKWEEGSTEFVVPPEEMRVYLRDNLQVQLIPSYEKYVIDNEGTIKWYRPNESGSLVENTEEFIPANTTENLIFFAKKEPKARKTTFSVNRDHWGKVVVRNPSPDNMYDQGAIIEVYAQPLKDLYYFSHWSDGNNQPARFFEVGSQHTDYKAIFRSNQIFAPKVKEEITE